MNIDRRQFLQGVLAAGAVAIGTGAVVQTAQAATPSGAGTGSAESFLLATGRRALG
jgi:hypothetical protein